jgi:hypothetical protein
MSCPKSQNASMVEESSQLDEAVAYVAEEGFFASVEPIGQVEWDALCTDHDTWLESSVRFTVRSAARCAAGCRWRSRASCVGLPRHGDRRASAHRSAGAGPHR